MHPLVRSALRAGALYGLRRTFAGSGARSGADLSGTRPVPPEVLEGLRPPRPDELLGHTTTGVGRFADVDPLHVPGWQRQRGRLLVLAALGAMSARRVRAELAARDDRGARTDPAGRVGADPVATLRDRSAG